jgi:hypothetical protein
LVLNTITTVAPPDVIDASLVEVKAVLPGKAFVLYGGELQVLHLGDRVWRGYLSKIITQQSKVEFILDEGGIIRRVEKAINFDKPKR